MHSFHGFAPSVPPIGNEQGSYIINHAHLWDWKPIWMLIVYLFRELINLRPNTGDNNTVSILIIDVI
jgi:hypothetical protein